MGRTGRLCAQASRSALPLRSRRAPGTRDLAAERAAKDRMMNYTLTPEARYIGRVLAGRYRIDGVLSESASFVLLRGDDLADGGGGRRVLVKLFPSESVAQRDVVAIARRESAVSALVAHPGVATATGHAIIDDGAHLLVLPGELGVPLRRLMAEGPMSLVRAARIVRQIALALDALHKAGVVHRALSPECVLVLAERQGERDLVKLTDFAFAKLGPADAPLPLEPGSIAAQYASPEVRAGRDADGQRDFYALGNLFSELVTGFPPAPGRESPTASMTSIRSVPAAVDALAARLLADDPSRRATIGVEVVKALDALSEPVPASVSTSLMSAPAVPSSAPFSSVPFSSAPAPSSIGLTSPPLSAQYPLSGTIMPPPSERGKPIQAVTGLITAPSVAAPRGAGEVPGDPGFIRSLPFRVRLYVVGAASIVIIIILVVALRSVLTGGVARHPSPKDLAEGSGTARAKPAATLSAPAEEPSSEPAPAAQLRARIEKDLRTANAGSFIANLDSLLDVEPSAAQDREIKNAIIETLMRIMVGEGPDIEKLFGIVQGKMGTAGPDVLYELMTTRGGSRAAKRAEELLRDEGVRARGTPALRIAYDLRTARSCEDKVALFDRAKTDADRRALGLLQLLNQDCGRRSGECCLHNDPGLKATIDAVKERLR